MGKLLKPFWSYVEKTETCWLWKGRKNSFGYGVYHRGILAHRIAWGMIKGKAAVGKELHHRLECPKNCINPEHLVELSKGEHSKLRWEEIRKMRDEWRRWKDEDRDTP